MNRITIIQELINKYNYSNYLEIGIRDKECFNQIVCKEKTGVDPAVSPNTYNLPDKGYSLTSDDFFSSLNSDIKYDIVFIDGLHEERQVDKDIANSIKHLTENGTIVLHDCNPPDLNHENACLCGTVWKSFYKFRKTQKEYEAFVVDVDYGCGVIQKKPSSFLEFSSEELTYHFLNNNRKEILNLKTPEEFTFMLENF
jgi:hypothetical protein